MEYFGNNEVTLKGCFHQVNPEITRRSAFIGNIMNHSARQRGHNSRNRVQKELK